LTQRRRSPWLKSQSDGFRPIKGVGVAVSIGFPLLVIGIFLLVIALGTGTTLLWWLGGGVLLAGLIAAVSGAVT
jgi:hypothetical protein